MKNNKREMLLTSLVCLLPLFAGAALYPRLPETMATHWDFSGNANGWSSRAATVPGRIAAQRSDDPRHRAGL